MSLEKLKEIAAHLDHVPQLVRRAALAAAIEEYKLDEQELQREVREAITTAEATAATDTTVTPELVTMLGDIAAAATIAPADITDTESPTDDTTGNDQDGGDTASGQVTHDEGPTMDAENEVVEGELVGAGVSAGTAGTVEFSSREVVAPRRVEVTTPWMPTRREPIPGSGLYSAFSAGENANRDGGGRFDDRNAMGAWIAAQMERMGRRGAGKFDRELVQFQANEKWDIPRVHNGMSLNQVKEALDLAVMLANRPADSAPAGKQLANFSAADSAAMTEEQRIAHFANTGWCSPSQDIYEFCGMPSLDGIIRLPSLLIERGGARFPVTPSLADLWGQGMLCQTEPEVMEREEDKPCIELGCPEWVDHRENVCHLCIISSILANRTFPEWVADQTDRLLIAFEHFMAAGIIAQMVENSESVTYATPDPHSTTEALLGAAEFVSENIRASERLGDDHPMNIGIPKWVRGAIRSDLAKRNGVSMFDVTDAQIEGYLGVRHIDRVQWLRNYQDALVEVDGFGSEASIQSGTWPATVRFLVWPEGAFVLGREEVITINGMYDSALIKQNKQLQLFTENAWALIPRCYQSYEVTIDLCSSGTTGAQAAFACPTL